MKDERGLYYYPNLSDKNFRAYVRQDEGTVWFRLWSARDPKLWEEHGWMPWEAIQKAAEMYTGADFDPRQAYDIDLARALIAEEDSS